MIQIILVSIGLSMDAFAVAVCKGLKMKKIDYKYTIIIASFFGIFQAVMPLIGWFLGKQFEVYIQSVDHWVAFILLAFIGGKMIYEAISDNNDDTEIKYDFKEITLLALATSIDALAVGISFALMDINIWVSVTLIGIITFVLSIIAVFIGNRFGMKYKSKAELLGGVILIIIGLKILLEGLNIVG